MSKVYLMDCDHKFALGVEGDIDPLELSILDRMSPLSPDNDMCGSELKHASMIRFRAAMARLGHEFVGIRPLDIDMLKHLSSLAESGYSKEYLAKLEQKLNATAPESG